MEQQVADAPLVAADTTAASGLLDEQSLDLLMATGNGLTEAALASRLASGEPIEH